MTNVDNLAQTKISGKRIAVVPAELAPMHRGHLHLVQKAAMENDGVVVVVSGSNRPNDRGMSINLPLERRFRYVREALNQEPTVRVVKLCENDMPDAPAGWDVWTKALVDNVNSVLTEDEIERTFTLYTGESHYEAELLPRVTQNWKVKQVDRSEIPISATKIRKNPKKYWDYIMPSFQRNFTKKVLVVGSASTGKSTLIRRLAQLCNTSFSEEFSRFYQMTYNVRDEELGKRDYSWLITGQFDLNSKAIDSPLNKGITFLDTDALVTRVYAKMYLPEAMDYLEPQFQYTIAEQEYDLILVIPPVTEYVDDGFRSVEWEGTRYEFHNELMAQLGEFNLLDKVAILDANDENGGFNARYEQAIQVIKERLDYDILG